MWYLYLILIVFTCSPVFGDEGCVTHNFGDGDDFVEFFSSGGFCGAMVPWLHERFDSTEIAQFHPYGHHFVRPQATHSCIYSTNFLMSSGGRFEFNIYMNPTTSSDQIRIIAYEADTQIIVGDVTSNIALNNFDEKEWNPFEFEVKSERDSFEGFIAISGRAASNTAILIDSFRYIPPLPIEDSSESNESEITEDSLGFMRNIKENDNDRCPIYDPLSYDCVEYNFEGDHNLIFATNPDICADTEEWERVTDTESGNSGMRPKVQGIPSCIAAPTFSVSTSGNLTVKIFVDSDSYFDSVVVAMNDDDDNIHAVAYNRLVNGKTEDGWYTLKLELEDISKEYAAQITFVGFATEGSTVLVDSFRFEPSAWNGDCKALENTRKGVVV